MSGIDNAPPPTPESVTFYIKRFPLHDLKYETDSKSTRKRTRDTYRIWQNLEEKGIRVVHDGTLNGRIRESLDSQKASLEGNGVTPSMESLLEAGRDQAQRRTICSENDLCGVMLTNFFDRSTDAINAGLPEHLHGEWRQCPDKKGSGRTDFVFRLGNGHIIAIVEVKLRTVLTTAGDDALSQTDDRDHPVEMTPRSMTQGDTAGREGAQSAARVAQSDAREAQSDSSEAQGDSSDSDPSQADQKDSDYVPSDEEEPDEQIHMHLSLRLEELLRECKQDQGLKLILAEREVKGGEAELALRIVDQEGEIVKNMTHWAMGLSQLWEQLDRYNLEFVILTSYDVWIPFQRDRQFENLLRMGDPIHRKAPGTATESGKMSPMELAVASVIGIKPAPPLGRTFLPLPRWPLSEAFANDSTQKNQNKRGAGASGSRGTKRGYDEVGGAGGAGSDNAIDGDGNVPRDQLVTVTLQVSVPNHRSPDALHVFKQRNLDNGYMTGRLSPSVIASLTDNDSIHLGLPTSELKAHLALGSYISSGRLWDVYHSVLTVEGRESKQLVAKVMVPDTYDDGDEDYKEFFENSKEAVAAYRLEAALYRGPLASLQGGAVPASYGSFSGAMSLALVSGGYPLHIELMEDVGVPAAGEGKLRDLPLQDRQAIRHLYRQIHAVRVLHIDIEPRHIRRRADGRFALIDFDASCSVEEGPEGDRRLASEGRRVAAILGLKDRVVGKAESRHLQGPQMVADLGAVGRGIQIV
ncbi:hypothetical protein L198_00005 [Cryptococcus wingfieldii CBS 7118]|uniref:Protein kinase domain-containing protein n=1 Tax=Cryptococcus wingfieldii CBS 7118 TaxID=1295528 RepID=A0A1E3K7S7_9TREE|nr:hypothetical protein L198_00005 [Cryptococcus wingfieldii CBS 7118]ODO08282.1 hypothetical protein L198_00005 [Cryptococcus wingfieldii CBS 7118]